MAVFVSVFRRLAVKEGFLGFHLVAENSRAEEAALFDRYLNSGASFKRRKASSPLQFVKELLIKRYRFNALSPIVFDYRKAIIARSRESLKDKEVAVLVTGWHTTARHKRRGTIYRDFTVANFKEVLVNVVAALREQSAEQPIVVIKSWNECAEGNLMEPDSVFGDALLKAYRDIVSAEL